jgi:hypothetical protein
MHASQLGSDAPPTVHGVLAYLNLSSGAADGRFRGGLNSLFGQLESGLRGVPASKALGELLQTELETQHDRSAALRDTSQAKAVLQIVFQHLPAAYRQWHRDLLFHQNDAALLRPFFLARACEAVLQEGPPWEETQRLVSGALRRLNDYVGYRPVAVLRSRQRREPYPHEWVCPVPWYFAGAGVAAGRYHDLIARALHVLQEAEPDLLQAAWLDPASIDELAVDPRAFDFDHPVAKRPNYQFGLWDPHTIDRRGCYRRFILQEVTLEALLERVTSAGPAGTEAALAEAAVVLAGIMLMASATSGSGPDTHDSTVTLATLLPHIARFRDDFYERRLAAWPGADGARLRAETARLRQPFGGARQHLNQRLAALRATQLQHVCMAQIFARLGYPEASLRQSVVLPVTSARMLCELDCLLAAAHHALDRGEIGPAVRMLSEMEDLLHRAIDCGAMVDPWNVLGFGGQFSLFPAPENSVRDHRVDVLVRLMDRLFGACARMWREAAAQADMACGSQIERRFRALAEWWDQFATATVEGVDRLAGHEALAAAGQVAAALAAWRAGGVAAGDLAFWRQHAADFVSPRSYGAVVEALLDKQDHVSAQALLVQWLGQADRVGWGDDERSFHRLALRWLSDVLAGPACAAGAPLTAEAARGVARFFDCLEANADDYWEPPEFALASVPLRGPESDPDDDESDDRDDSSAGLYRAAYEEVTYRDTTADGVEGSTLDGLPATDFELEHEAERLERHLAFHRTLARLWELAALRALADGDRGHAALPLDAWRGQAQRNSVGLRTLLCAIQSCPVPDVGPGPEALAEYDRRRGIKELLLDRTVATCVALSDAERLLAAAVDAGPAAGGDSWEGASQFLVRAVGRRESAAARAAFPAFRAALAQQTLLYVPLSRRGDPVQALAARERLSLLRQLVRHLPQLGLLRESCQLIAAAQRAESDHPVGAGALTEFDRLFDDGLRALVDAVIEVSGAWPAGTAGRGRDADLADCLQAATETLLRRWKAHSGNLRLSALERVADDARWQEVVEFVQQYGRELFTPRFLQLGHVRGILHQGVEAWLRKLEESAEPDGWERLLEDLRVEQTAPRRLATLQLILEAVVENYAEFKDYNSITTQSDRGELLHLLLDVLRVKASYERVAWNLRPVLLVHELLVRRGRLEAAELWRRALVERTTELADRHVQALEDLFTRYGMRLPTVTGRIQERFVRPLAVARLRALVRPALDESRAGKPPRAFQKLEEEVQEFLEYPVGAGLDVPEWIVALQDELAEWEVGRHGEGPRRWSVAQVPLSREEAQAQFDGE